MTVTSRSMFGVGRASAARSSATRRCRDGAATRWQVATTPARARQPSHSAADPAYCSTAAPRIGARKLAHDQDSENTPWYRPRIATGDSSALVAALDGALSISPTVQTSTATPYTQAVWANAF